MGLVPRLQMTWQPSLLRRRKAAAPIGLKNLGNSCYLNSVLQCLTYTPPLANFCLRFQHSSLCDSDKKRECPFCILEKRIARSLSVDLAFDAPAKIQSCLRIFAEHFRGGRQEDAHEFLRYVIDACHNTCLRLKKLRRKAGDNVNGNTVVKEIFGGALQSQVKCLACGTESNKVDEIMDISLDILHSSSLKEALHKFFQPEVLDGNNKYKCENCKKLVAARKQMSIYQAPNVLVVQLKRFEGIFGVKIDKAVAFEEVLVLSNFMCRPSQDSQAEYNLFGTIVHSGFSPESGHYYAYIKDAMGKWYCCNDSFVSLSTLQEVLSEKVYILFFSRTNQRTVHANMTGSRGVKSHDLNGSSPVQSKGMHTKCSAEQLLEKGMSTVSKVGKVPTSPRVKFNICEKSPSGRIFSCENENTDLHQSYNVAANGVGKDSVHVFRGQKDLSPRMNKNCLEQNETDNSVDGECRKGFAFTNGNSFRQRDSVGSVKPDPCEGNSSKTKMIPGERSNLDELSNGHTNYQSNLLVPKRKLEQGDSLLLAQDARSREEVEKLKQTLIKKASSVLRSCGWTANVHDFMSSRKRLCVGEAGRTLVCDDLKKKLIADAKTSFISQIPESLKEEFIKRLQLFSQQRQGP